MTVCIATICTYGAGEYIILAADRMITAGDIEYEPDEKDQPKVRELTTHSLAMFADEITPQSTICDDTVLALSGRTNTPATRDVVGTYVRNFQSFRLQRNVSEILSPVGLTQLQFQQMMQQPQKSAYLEELEEEFHYKKLGVETIIAGVDMVGDYSLGSIYRVEDPGDSYRQDSVGFTAIGSGADHAESQFMLARYNRKWLYPDALVLIYVAKKRAERAPGVGKDTDIYMIGHAGVSTLTGETKLIAALDESYIRIEKQELEARREAYKAVSTAFEEWMNDTRRPQEAAETQATGSTSYGAEAGEAGVSESSETSQPPDPYTR